MGRCWSGEARGVVSSEGGVRCRAGAGLAVLDHGRGGVGGALGAGLLAAALLTTGCEDMGAGVVACDRPATPEPLPYHGGTVEDGVYMSSPWDGELLFFPGGAWYDVYHQLGEVPQLLQFYLSFERNGVAEGSLAPASGNQVEIKAISDESVTVLNGSCVDYWLVVVAAVAGDGAAR
jgi:hypothetical protein